MLFVSSKNSNKPGFEINITSKVSVRNLSVTSSLHKSVGLLFNQLLESFMPQWMQKLAYQSVEVVIFRVICNSTKKLNENFCSGKRINKFENWFGLKKLLV